MLGVRLSQDLKQRLDQLSKETHRSKSYYVKIALEEFLKFDPSAQQRILHYFKKRILTTDNPQILGKTLTRVLQEFWSYRLGRLSQRKST